VPGNRLNVGAMYQYPISLFKARGPLHQGVHVRYITAHVLALTKRVFIIGGSNQQKQLDDIYEYSEDHEVEQVLTDELGL
jgi:hypothetical protein